MAGNYPDAPSWRMAYDRDGTQVYKITGTNTLVQLTAAELKTLNDEADGSYTAADSGNGGLVFIFPELRDVDAIFHVNDSATAYAASAVTASVSVNTTNGLDGTWSSISIAANAKGIVKPLYRTGVLSSTALAVRAVKFMSNGSGGSMWVPSAIHLYGEPAPGENPDRLALWHPTLDQRVTPQYFDWGNVPRNSSADKLFRVKNLSSTLTGNSIRVAMESLTDTTPSVPAQHSLSYGGGAFLAQVNIGALAPGAISSPVTMRRITPSNAVLSLWSFRVFAEASSWS